MNSPELQKVPARKGKATYLKAGQAIKIINTYGSQVVDTWCFNASDMEEFMSMEHHRVITQSMFPVEGDFLYTNNRRAILLLEKDTSPGRHDTLMAACDTYRYNMLGSTGYHDNCTDNLHSALSTLNLVSNKCPSPLNLWMNIPFKENGKINFDLSLASPGDYIILRAQIDCIVVMSTCPQDMVPINGKECKIKAVHFELLNSPF